VIRLAGWHVCDIKDLNLSAHRGIGVEIQSGTRTKELPESPPVWERPLRPRNAHEKPFLRGRKHEPLSAAVISESIGLHRLVSRELPQAIQLPPQVLRYSRGVTSRVLTKA
jgi:hypothetical protein